MSERKKQAMNKKKVFTIAGMGLLTAIVVVLQALTEPIKFGMFAITLTLVPIIVGAALFGKYAGAWLGFVFSIVVLFTDAGAFLAVSVPGTIVTVIVKGTTAGLAAGLVYSLIEKKSKIGAVIAAGIAAPVVNTGIFVAGCFLFFYDFLSEAAASFGYASGASYILFGMIGLNFLVELGINMALSTVIAQIIKLGKKQFGV